MGLIFGIFWDFLGYIVIRIDVQISRISRIRTDFGNKMLGFKQKIKKIRKNP
jgi:hypothetical protein